jgi:hypothetical protein
MLSIIIVGQWDTPLYNKILQYIITACFGQQTEEKKNPEKPQS